MASTFEQKLDGLINECSLEMESDTPSFILAQYIRGCLDAYNKTVHARDNWYNLNLTNENSIAIDYDAEQYIDFEELNKEV